MTVKSPLPKVPSISSNAARCSEGCSIKLLIYLFNHRRSTPVMHWVRKHYTLQFTMIDHISVEQCFLSVLVTLSPYCHVNDFFKLQFMEQCFVLVSASPRLVLEVVE